jgi:hypothetical protein
VPWLIAGLIAAVIAGVILFLRRRRTPVDTPTDANTPAE